MSLSLSVYFSHGFSLFNLPPPGHATVYRSKNYQLLPRVVDVGVRCSYCVCRETTNKWSLLVNKDPKCFKFTVVIIPLSHLYKCCKTANGSLWKYISSLYLNGCFVLKSKHILTCCRIFFHIWLFKEFNGITQVLQNKYYFLPS